MFNKSLSEQRKGRRQVIREYKSAMKSRLYNGWDIIPDTGTIIENEGAKYTVEPASKLIIDHYDNGSVELSHSEGLGFSIIKLWYSDTDTLDLSFARPQDHIDLELDESISTIQLNSANIRYAQVQGPAKYKFNISKNTDTIDFGISLDYFIKNNQDVIDSIYFQDLGNEMQKAVARRICSRNQLENISFNSKSNKRRKVHSKEKNR